MLDVYKTIMQSNLQQNTTLCKHGGNTNNNIKQDSIVRVGEEIRDNEDPNEISLEEIVAENSIENDDDKK